MKEIQSHLFPSDMTTWADNSMSIQAGGFKRGRKKAKVLWRNYNLMVPRFWVHPACWVVSDAYAKRVRFLIKKGIET